MAAVPSNANMFARFLHSQVFGSLLLVFATLIALLWANSEWGDVYYDLSHVYIGISAGDWSFKMTLSHWIKDGLMAIFFFVVGLEIKREVVVGELSSVDKAMLPVCAALGGALVPALFYWIVNPDRPEAIGWGIPMATDIAFALGVLSLFGSRVPIELKLFLTALAIADDLLAVVVIAVFYTPNLDIVTLLLAIIPMVTMAIMNKAGVRATWIYTLLALLVWASVLGSGVHATIAGVLVAMVIPVRPAVNPNQFMDEAAKLMDGVRGEDNSFDAFNRDPDRRRNLERLELLVEDAIPPAIALEHRLHPFQSFVILPLFALFSAGVVLNADTLEGFPSGISLGILAGLVLGKPIGVGLASFAVIRLRGGASQELPLGQLLGAGCLAGIGFTMSIFISELAFESEALIDQAKVGILAASLTAGVIGAIVLHLTLPKS